MIMFGNDDKYAHMMKELLKEIVNSTLQICLRLPVNRTLLSEKSDSIETFFTTLALIYKKVPQLITANDIDNAALFQCGNVVTGAVIFRIILCVTFQL